MVVKAATGRSRCPRCSVAASRTGSACEAATSRATRRDPRAVSENMTHLNRRQFLVGATFCGANPGGLRAASKARGRMRITDIELHEILAPYHDYNAKTIFR